MFSPHLFYRPGDTYWLFPNELLNNSNLLWRDTDMYPTESTEKYTTREDLRTIRLYFPGFMHTEWSAAYQSAIDRIAVELMIDRREDLDDEVLVSGLSPSQAGKFIRAFDTQMTIPRVFDRGSFRCFELVLIRSKESHLRTVLAAAVPKTADLEADRMLAMEMIDIQAFEVDGIVH